MGVRTSNKATDSTVKDFKYYMGVIPYNVVAVNPSLNELKALGIDYLTEEPQYQSSQEFDGKVIKNAIVDFWVKSLSNPEFPEMEILTKIQFRINHEVYVGTNSGKTQFINKYGRTAWAMTVADLDANKYYENVGSRPAHNGEEDLHKFLFAWLNMTYDPKTKVFDDCLINVDAVIAGNFSELKSIVAGSKEYIVKLLTGVQVTEKDGKIRYYQTVYNQMFLKHNQTSTNRLQEYVDKDEYTAFSTDKRPVFYSYDIREFDKSVKPDADPEPQQNTAVAQDVF